MLLLPRSKLAQTKLANHTLTPTFKQEDYMFRPAPRMTSTFHRGRYRCQPGGGILYPDGTLASANVYNPAFNDFSIGSGITAFNNQGTIIFSSAGPFIATPDYPVPEPASVGLLVAAVGLVTLGVFRRYLAYSTGAKGGTRRAALGCDLKGSLRTEGVKST